MNEKKTFVQERFSAMQMAKGHFDQRWQRAQEQLFKFRRMSVNGEQFFPNAFVTINKQLEDVLDVFDGSIAYLPTIISSSKDKSKLEVLTNVYNQENQKVNVQNQRKLAIQDAYRYGIGVLFEGYLGQKGGFDGLVTQCIDTRDFFIDESAQCFYEPTNQLGARDCIRRKFIPASDFEKIYSDSDFNQKNVKIASKDAQRINREANQIISIDSLDENADNLVEVFEYWSSDKLIIEQKGIKLYEGENPYEMLPFIIYNLYSEHNTLYPTQMLELLTPMFIQKDLQTNLNWLNAKSSSLPILFAKEETGLIAGEEIEPGVQIVENSAEDISKSVYEMRIGNTSQAAMNYLAHLENEIIAISGTDTKALQTRPSELATQTKKKQQFELKQIRNSVSTMMITAETQRAILRGRNIIKFIFANAKDILINDFKGENGKIVSSKGSTFEFEITPDDWKRLQFDVIVKRKDQQIIEESEKNDNLLRATELAKAIKADPNIPEEVRNKVNLNALVEEVLKTLPDIDEQKIIDSEQTKDKTKELSSQIQRGETPNMEGNEAEMKENLISGALANKDNAKGFIKSLVDLQTGVKKQNFNEPV